jgi:hypothetical protein
MRFSFAPQLHSPLTVSFRWVQQESYVSAFRLEAAEMMKENPFLRVSQPHGSGIKVEEFLQFDFLSFNQHNTQDSGP